MSEWDTEYSDSYRVYVLDNKARKSDQILRKTPRSATSQTENVRRRASMRTPLKTSSFSYGDNRRKSFLAENSISKRRFAPNLKDETEISSQYSDDEIANELESDSETPNTANVSSVQITTPKRPKMQKKAKKREKESHRFRTPSKEYLAMQNAVYDEEEVEEEEEDNNENEEEFDGFYEGEEDILISELHKLKELRKERMKAKIAEKRAEETQKALREMIRKDNEERKVRKQLLEMQILKKKKELELLELEERISEQQKQKQRLTKIQTQTQTQTKPKLKPKTNTKYTNENTLKGILKTPNKTPTQFSKPQQTERRKQTIQTIQTPQSKKKSVQSSTGVVEFSDWVSSCEKACPQTDPKCYRGLPAHLLNHIVPAGVPSRRSHSFANFVSTEPSKGQFERK